MPETTELGENGKGDAAKGYLRVFDRVNTIVFKRLSYYYCCFRGVPEGGGITITINIRGVPEGVWYRFQTGVLWTP